VPTAPQLYPFPHVVWVLPSVPCLSAASTGLCPWATSEPSPSLPASPSPPAAGPRGCKLCGSCRRWPFRQHFGNVQGSAGCLLRFCPFRAGLCFGVPFWHPGEVQTSHPQHSNRRCGTWIRLVPPCVGWARWLHERGFLIPLALGSPGLK